MNYIYDEIKQYGTKFIKIPNISKFKSPKFYILCVKFMRLLKKVISVSKIFVIYFIIFAIIIYQMVSRILMITLTLLSILENSNNITTVIALNIVLSMIINNYRRNQMKLKN